MNVNYYTALVAQIRTITDFSNVNKTWVRLYNGQFEHEKEEYPFNFPCCLIEFVNDIEKVRAGAMVSYYNVTVRIHLGFQSVKTEDTAIFTLKDKIAIALEGWRPSTMTNATPLMGTAERVDINHSNIYDYQLDFVARIPTTATDRSTATITDIQTTTDLMIDDLVIRTGHTT